MNLLRMSESRWRRGIAGVLATSICLISPLLAAPKPGAKSAEKKAKEPAAPQPAALPSPTPAKAPAEDDLYEGAAVARPTSRPAAVRRPVSPNHLVAPVSPGPKFADAWPSEYRVAEADLHLAPEGEAKAEAIAEVVRAQVAEERGDADVALEAFKRAAALDPTNGVLAVKVAVELAKRNEPGEAIRILKDSIAANPKEPRTHVYLAQIYAKHLNKPDLGMQAAQKALEASPDYFPAWATVFEIYEQGADKKKAGEVLDKALKSTSKNPEFWMQLGTFLQRALLKEDETVPAEDLKRMEVAFRKAAELKPQDASVLTRVGDFYALARDQKQALEFYEKAIALNQAPTDEATRNLREKHIHALVKNNRTAEAIPLLEKLAKDPAAGTRHELFELLGELYQQSGQMDKAIEHYRQSLVLDAGEPRNHLFLANVQMKAKRFDDAVATMKQAKEKFPDRPQVSYFLASALSRAKKHQEAMDVFQSLAKEARGRDESLLDGDFYFQWGATAEQAGDLDKAAELMKKAIELSPEAAEPYNYLGYMWVDKGLHLEEAGALIRKALEIEPKNGAYLDSLGWYYFKVGKFDDARRELLAALDALKEEGKDEDPVVLDHLADTYEKLGQFGEAISFWEKALTHEPENPEKLREKIESARKRTGK
jgi:tetratricopeptide (TPR) repeat protein